MSDRTAIEWTDATWNPVRGCSRVSQGCVNCYAEVMAARFSDPGQWGHGLATRVALPGGGIDHRWTGRIEAAPEAVLLAPLRWKRARRIFVDSTSDLFHENTPDGLIMRVLDVMAHSPRHTYQILTKRPERMRDFFARWNDLQGEDHDAFRNARGPDAVRKAHPSGRGQLFAAMLDAMGTPPPGAAWPTFDWAGGMMRWGTAPFPNVWLGTSVEDQATAEARIPHLLATPAAVRFISAEPLLGPVDLTELSRPMVKGVHEYSALECDVDPDDDEDWHGATIDWVICGGESGAHARPMHPDWARSLRDQCGAAGVPFFFKQWGEWLPFGQSGFTAWASANIRNNGMLGKRWLGYASFNDGAGGPNNETVGPVETCNVGSLQQAVRLGKAAAGRLLDGREWNQFPGAV